MKNFIVFVLFLAGFGCNVSSQKISQNDVPAAVKNEFIKIYPTVTEVKWEKEEGKYEAAFTLNNIATSSLFDEKGELIETETSIDISMVPTSALDYFKKNFAGEKIRETAKTVTAKGVVTYEIEANKKEIYFDDKGGFIKVKKSK